MQALEKNPSVTTNATKPKFLTDKCCGIYGLRHKADGKWYVGQSVDIETRLNDYRKLRCSKQPKIYRALLKHGFNSFDVVLLENCESVDWILDYREMFWIKRLDSVKNGYNITHGGHNGRHMTGIKKSEETKLKISKSLLGVKNYGVSFANKTRFAKTRFRSGNSISKGTVWINNGVQNRRIKKSDQILVGWVRGRLLPTALE